VLEALILSGVLDKFGEKRATLFHNLDRLAEIGTRARQYRAYGQASLFDSEQIAALTHVELEQTEDWPRTELLRLEKQNLGFFFSGHPLDDYAELIEKHRDLKLDALETASTSRTYTAVGILRDIKEHITRKGGKMAFAKLLDDRSSVECVIFTRVFENRRDLLKDDNIVVLRGRVDRSRGEPKFLVDDIQHPEEFKSASVSAVHVRLDGDPLKETSLYQLRDFIFDKGGRCSLFLHLNTAGRSAETVIRASSAITIRPDADVLERMQSYPSVMEVWKE